MSTVLPILIGVCAAVSAGGTFWWAVMKVLSAVGIAEPNRFQRNCGLAGIAGAVGTVAFTTIAVNTQEFKDEVARQGAQRHAEQQRDVARPRDEAR
jgi:hypothetical protein